MMHAIKIRESFADAVNRGDKTFEVRKNDRGYQKGDTVRFIVLYDSNGCEMVSHPLLKKEYEITYVLSGWGIEDGYCVFGIKPKEGRSEDGKKILEFLKENEKIKPKAIMGTSIYSCGKCDHAVAEGMSFCPVCGCLIDW